MKFKQKIAPCLWFDSEAEQAANFYVSVFKNSKIVDISHYVSEGKEIHGQPEGKVLMVAFELEGQSFAALNGGPLFKFNEAISLQIYCETQDEIDYFWAKLGADGDPNAQQCGWLKDKFGLSWQVVATPLIEMLQDKDKAKAGRAMNAILKMKKLDIAELRKAFNG